MKPFNNEYEQELHSGNRFFEHKFPSVRLDKAIDTMNTFEEFEEYYTGDLMDEDLLLGRYLEHLLKEHGYNSSKASKGIGKHESYVGKIVSGEVVNPSRDVLLAICILIGATVEETQILMRYSGKQPLYARRKRDAIIWFALKKRALHQRDDGKLYLESLNDYLERREYSGLIKIIVKGEREKKKK